MLAFEVIRKLIGKAIVLVSLVALTLFTSVLKLAIFVFGLAAIPVSTFAVIAGIVVCVTEGFSMEILSMFIGAGALIALKYLLPLLPQSLDIVKFSMKEYLYEPLIIRSPVKYTI